MLGLYSAWHPSQCPSRTSKRMQDPPLCRHKLSLQCSKRSAKDPHTIAEGLWETFSTYVQGERGDWCLNVIHFILQEFFQQQSMHDFINQRVKSQNSVDMFIQNIFFHWSLCNETKFNPVSWNCFPVMLSKVQSVGNSPIWSMTSKALSLCFHITSVALA